ncbi:hypothetical protein Q1695_007889 [Nippostrongylus brasiliensis]|nr:hypothetical protein Q1695_007889 [Nippostrongylus brasiliensis]
MITTCRHNNDWKAYRYGGVIAITRPTTIGIMRKDIQLNFLSSSVFCRVFHGPDSRCPFRFLWSLGLGCISVVLSDVWSLPFYEGLDLSAAAVLEDSVLLVSDILYTYRGGGLSVHAFDAANFCDFDIAGQYDLIISAAECLEIVDEVLSKLDIVEFHLNHRFVLEGMFAACGAGPDQFKTVRSFMDKLDKQPWVELDHMSKSVRELPP